MQFEIAMNGIRTERDTTESVVECGVVSGSIGLYLPLASA